VLPTLWKTQNNGTCTQATTKIKTCTQSVRRMFYFFRVQRKTFFLDKNKKIDLALFGISKTFRTSPQRAQKQLFGIHKLRTPNNCAVNFTRKEGILFDIQIIFGLSLFCILPE